MNGLLTGEGWTGAGTQLRLGTCECIGLGSRQPFAFLLRKINGGSDSKESVSNAEDQGLIPGSGRYPGEGNGNALQYWIFSCLGNSINRGDWQAQVLRGHTELDVTALGHAYV